MIVLVCNIVVGQANFALCVWTNLHPGCAKRQGQGQIFISWVLSLWLAGKFTTFSWVLEEWLAG